MDLLVFLAANWGNLASVLGAALTVYFAVKAERAAISARQASEATRSRIGAIDVLADLNRVVGRIDDLKHRIDANSWQVASERATEVRITLSTALATKTTMSRNTRDSLSAAVSQFKSLAVASDKAYHKQPEQSEMVRLRRIIADQKEVVIIAMLEVRNLVGAN